MLHRINARGGTLAVEIRNWCSSHPLQIGIPAGILFLAILALAIHDERHLHMHVQFVYLPFALLFTLPLIALNAVEFVLIGTFAGQHISRRQALAVSLSGSVANLLPVPGSVVLRAGLLRSAGSSTRDTMRAIALVGLIWVGVTMIIFGSVSLGRDAGAGGFLLAIGLASTGSCTHRLRVRIRQVQLPALLLPSVIGVEVGTVLVESVRLWCVLHMMGFHAQPVDGVALDAASVLTTAAGIFPAGLGLREGLSAAFGAASGMPAAVAVTSAVIDRVVVLCGLGLVGAVFIPWIRLSARRSASGASEHLGARDS